MVPGEPPPSDPSAQAWLLPRPGTKHAGYQGPGSRASLEARAGRLEGQTSCLRGDVARGSKGDKKMLGPAGELGCGTSEKLKDADT